MEEWKREWESQWECEWSGNGSVPGEVCKGRGRKVEVELGKGLAKSGRASGSRNGSVSDGRVEEGVGVAVGV